METKHERYVNIVRGGSDRSRATIVRILDETECSAIELLREGLEGSALGRGTTVNR